jgi:hypothetical protein
LPEDQVSSIICGKKLETETPSVFRKGFVLADFKHEEYYTQVLLHHRGVLAEVA